MAAAALQAFEQVVGKDWIFSSDVDVALYRDPYSPLKGQAEELLAAAAVAPKEVSEVQEIVRIAESQLGHVESPLGSNCNPYGRCEQWCSLFVAWVWEKAGVPLEGGTAPYAYSGSIYEWAKAHEAAPSLGGMAAPGESPFSRAEPDGARVLPPGATPAPGDAVLFGSGPQASDHIGIVERVFPGGQITTIDGNYSDRVSRVGPFLPSRAVEGGEPAPIFGYAQPPGVAEAAEGAVR